MHIALPVAISYMMQAGKAISLMVIEHLDESQQMFFKRQMLCS
jgi:hypothetical protein